MNLNDKINFIGVFSVKSLDANGQVIDEFSEKNLIMNNARTNMAQLIGGVDTGSVGEQINKIVLGTLGHNDSDILDPKVAGVDYDTTRTQLFSEAQSGAVNYRIPFDVTGGEDVTVSVEGTRYEGSSVVGSPESGNSIQRVVSGTTVTYTITIPAANANDGIVAYTEAALYAGTDIFSMKTFPARVKEDTVQFEITWSIIF